MPFIEGDQFDLLIFVLIDLVKIMNTNENQVDGVSVTNTNQVIPSKGSAVR